MLMMSMTVVAMTACGVSPGKASLAPFGGPQLLDVRTAAAQTLANSLVTKHYTVLGPAAIDGLLSPDQQLALKDCVPEVVGCYTKFATTLAVDSVIIGTLGKASDSGQVSIDVKVYSAADSHLLASATGQAANEGSLPAALEQLALALVVQFEVAPEPVVPPPPETGLGAAFWAPVISGLVVAGAGTYVLVSAVVDLDAAKKERGTSISEEDYAVRVSKDLVQRNVGITGISLGAASILAGVIFGRPKPAPAPVSVSLGGFVTPSGGSVVLRGAF